MSGPAPQASAAHPADAAAGNAGAAVWAADVGFDYRRRRALDGVGFAVAPGTVFGFLGPNGSGKTTLFRLLATLLPAQQGRLVVAGHDVAREPRRVRGALGVAFQSPSLDLRLSVEENLRHHGHLYGLAGRELARRIDEGLERFAVADRRRERAEALSGGLRRRVELAKALLHRPPVLLLDEPSTGLDPRARRDLGAVLEELAADGVTVLLTTHFIEEAEACHRLLVLDRGHVVAAGTPRELTAEVGGEVVTLTAVEGGARNAGGGEGTGGGAGGGAGGDAGRAGGMAGELAADLEAALAGMGVAARPEIAAGAVRLELSGDGEAGAAWELVGRLARRLPRWEERVAAVTVARPTLEDVFLHRTGRRLDDAPGELAAADARAMDQAPAGGKEERR